jgi:hypothetical protein
MSAFTTTLPSKLLDKLAEHAQKLSVPKNKIIEKALEIYLDQLNRAEYVRSYKRMNDDVDVLSIAEEGMVDYCQQMKEI